MTPRISRICMYLLPLGNAAWATRAVSSGTGVIGVGCSVMGSPFLHCRRHCTPLCSLPRTSPLTRCSISRCLIGICQQYRYRTPYIAIPEPQTTSSHGGAHVGHYEEGAP